MIKLIITDIGGVLIKTDEAIIQCIERVFSENNIPLGSKEKLLSVFGVSLYDYVKNYLPDGYEDKADFCYRELRKIYPAEARHLMKVFPNVDKTLKSIKEKGIKIAVLSCMIREEVEENLSLLKFNDFETVFALEDYGYKRPLPNGLNMIMKKISVKPEETIYIGDTVNDIKMAKNANVVSVAVRTGAQDNSRLEEADPDYLVDDFSEIINIL